MKKVNLYDNSGVAEAHWACPLHALCRTISIKNNSGYQFPRSGTKPFLLRSWSQFTNLGRYFLCFVVLFLIMLK